VQWLIHSNSNPTEINKGELAEPVALFNTPYDGQCSAVGYWVIK